MEILLDYSIDEIKQKMEEIGEQKFRAAQIFTALNCGKSFSEITTINHSLKDKLLQNFISQPVTILNKLLSNDGTVKFLFKLHDNNIIEGVLMQYKYGYTLCVSTQVGCRMHCKFCASGINGLVRNLSAGEILGQVIQANNFLQGKLGEDRKVTNVVLMGSGEPLDNYDNVTKFIDLVTCESGLNISQRNISISTCGIVPNIKKLADDGYKITLTISLHAPDDKRRKKIMPIANKYSIEEIMTACRYYFKKTKRRIILEYVLIAGINNDDYSIEKLSKLPRMFSYHINIIALNNVDESGLKATTRENAKKFVEELQKRGCSATLRRTMGQDIEGACGQLRMKFLQGKT